MSCIMYMHVIVIKQFLCTACVFYELPVKNDCNYLAIGTIGQTC